MRLSPARFDAALSGALGQHFMWRRAWSCACVNPASGAAKPNCPVCDGKRVFWDAEVPAMAGAANMSPQRAIGVFGAWEPGDAVFTIPEASPLYAIGQNDRLRAVDATAPFSTVIQPGLNDKLMGTVVSVSRVFWMNDGGTAVVDGALPLVAPDGSMSWASNGPPTGVTYTVTGVKYLEYFAFRNLAAPRNIGVSGLPLKLPARLFDVFGR